ncbi:hypothetical protein D9V37_19920 [Nocardioides mangrovicus]|uniref:Uncharacterized protein n=1 Tax=Nocardioides mangrovicus TaxID=2478913 RepID=A0A3L8P139_9ACTN|nr:Ig-like domain-containing protein [Nocardioides mangrovicus]RLV48309.1 hypothetical protein D9V37_19920 [Nocardioides mangrovicus]
MSTLRPRRLLAGTAFLATSLATAGLGGAASAASAVSASVVDGDCPAMTPLSHTSATAPTVRDDAVNVVAGSVTTIPVLANDTDADADQLALVKVDAATHGIACALADGTVSYLSLPSTHATTDTFRYAVTDGDYYRSGTITVTAAADTPVVAHVTRRARDGHRATIRFTNANAQPVRLLLGSQKAKRPAVRRTIAPGHTAVVHTGLDKPVYLASLRVAGVGGVPLTFGTINTRTGKVHTQDVSDVFASVMAVGRAGLSSAAHQASPWR